MYCDTWNWKYQFSLGRRELIRQTRNDLGSVTYWCCKCVALGNPVDKMQFSPSVMRTQDRFRASLPHHSISRSQAPVTTGSLEWKYQQQQQQRSDQDTRRHPDTGHTGHSPTAAALKDDVTPHHRLGTEPILAMMADPILLLSRSNRSSN